MMQARPKLRLKAAALLLLRAQVQGRAQGRKRLLRRKERLRELQPSCSFLKTFSLRSQQRELRGRLLPLTLQRQKAQMRKLSKSPSRRRQARFANLAMQRAQLAEAERARERYPCARAARQTGHQSSVQQVPHRCRCSHRRLWPRKIEGA
jgi:hypothetical protein